MLPRPLLIALFCASLSIDADYSSEIDKYIKKFANANKDEIDVLKTLTDVAGESRFLLEVGGPVGSLIAAGLNTAYKPDSDELRAITKLHEAMKQQYKAMVARLEINGVLNVHVLAEFEYRREVKSKFDVLFDIFELVTNPKLPRTNLKQRFINTCNDPAYNPKTILNYLNDIFHEDCSLPTKDHIRLFARVHRAFRHIELRIRGEKSLFLSLQYEDIKRRVLTHVPVINSGTANKFISKLENISASTQDDLLKEIQTLMKDEPIKETCMLHAVSKYHNHNREQILAVVRQLVFDLLEAELMTMACANITSGDKAIAGEATMIIETIGKYEVSWVEEAQRLSWPEVGIETAKNALGFDTFPVEKFNSKARDVQAEFEKIGTESYYYQVLITGSGKPFENWNLRTREGVYANFTNYNGIDCHVFRYSQGESVRAENAAKWFAEKKVQLLKLIEKNRHNDYASRVFMLMESEFGSFVDSERYQSAILLYNQAWFASNARVNTGLASYLVDGINATNYVDYFEDPLIMNAFNWKLFLLL